MDNPGPMPDCPIPPEIITRSPDLRDHDKHLALIRLLSSGSSKDEVMRSLGLSKRGYTVKLKAAALRLSRKTGLSGGALYALLSPRERGTPPPAGYFPRYSGAAVTIDKAYELDVFHEVVEAVVEASEDWDAFGLDDLARWLSGHRPSDGTTNVAACALGTLDYDLVLHVRPEGFKFERMVGAIAAIDLAIDESDCESSALCGSLNHDVPDPRSTIEFHEGARVAVTLSDNDQLRWKAFVAEQGVPVNERRCVRLVHVAGASPGISFLIP